MRKVKVLNTDTGVEFHLTEELWEIFRNDYKFVGYEDLDEVKSPSVAPAENDIHQMNKVALLDHAKDLSIKVSPKMSVGKIKEAIEDHLSREE